MNVEHEKARCKFCSSQNTVKNGKRKGTQFWLCRGCWRAFVDNGALPRMRNRIECVASAVTRYYAGYSLSEVCEHIERKFGIRPSRPAVYLWVMHFSGLAVDKTKDCKPRVGDTWIADEMVLKIGGRDQWLWEILDSSTWYVLAMHITPTRTKKDARVLMKSALEKAGQAPKLIFTGRLRTCLDDTEMTLGSSIGHMRSEALVAPESAHLVNRFHVILRDCAEVLKNTRKLETARVVGEGWVVSHNYFRKYEFLGGRTPAEFAGVTSPFRRWLDVVNSQVRSC